MSKNRVNQEMMGKTEIMDLLEHRVRLEHLVFKVQLVYLVNKVQ